MWGRRGRDGALIAETVGRYWWAILSPTIVLLLPVGLITTFVSEDSWGLAALAQLAYVSAMCFGLMGLFRQFLSQKRRGWIRDWDLPAGVKFVGITAAVSLILLASYQFLVRYSPTGTLLNETRTGPAAQRAASGS